MTPWPSVLKQLDLIALNNGEPGSDRVLLLWRMVASDGSKGL